MRTLLSTLAAAVVLAAVAPAAPVPKPKQKTDADRIVGVWKMVKRDGNPIDMILELTADGKITLRTPARNGIPEDKETGKYKVADGKIEYTFARDGGPERGGTDTIKKLTDDEMILVDSDDIAEEFTRIKDEKKAEKK